MSSSGGGTTNPWIEGDGPRGEDYDRRFDRLAAAGHDVHGEANLVESLAPGSVLDAGCGTGRVAIELARRGIDVAAVDLDPDMIAAARRKAPDLPWTLGDLATVDLGRRFDAAVMAGNVMIFVTPGTEGTVLANLARHVEPAGLVIAGFSLGRRLQLPEYDLLAEEAGLRLWRRWSTWDREPYLPGADYAVSVHRREPADRPRPESTRTALASVHATAPSGASAPSTGAS